MKKHISNIREKAGRHKTLIQNFSYLSALQVFNMLLPLITYPYLIRILGANLYGLVIFANVTVTYFAILIDFGLNLTATKEISIHKNDKTKLNEIISSTLILKLGLWVISLLILLCLIWFIPSLSSHKLLYLFSFTICFNELLFPRWYFQGIERMKYITLINLISRIIFLILIFVVVNDQSKYLYVPLLNGIGAFIGGSIGLFVMLVKDKNKLVIPPLNNITKLIKESLPLFGSNAVISVKDKFNVIFIGMFLGMREVAIYDLSIKIMTLFIQPIDILNTTIYPKVAKDKNMSFMLKFTKLSFLFVLGAVLFVQPFLHPIINFLGKGLSEAIIPTRILLIAPLIMVWSVALGRNCLIVSGENKIFLIGMLLTTLFYLMLISVAYILNISGFVMVYVIISVLTYLFELLYRVYFTRKLKLCSN